MDQQQASTPAVDEARRRGEVLAMLAGRRRRRRVLTGLAVGAAAALVATGSVAAWSSQDAAAATAAQIGAWHDDRDLAVCDAEARAVAAVALAERAEGVLRAADHVRDAEQLLGAPERAAFEEARGSVLRSIDDGAFTTQEDRSTAARWASLAAASGDAAGFDVRDACLAEAAQAREPVEGVTAERAAALQEELRQLGEADAVSTERFDRLDAAIGAVAPTVLALADSRATIATLREAFALAPADALASLEEDDRQVADLAAAVRSSGTADAALDLVERLSLQVASTWMAESFQLEAVGLAEEAAARAAAARGAQAAVAEVRPAPTTPAPAEPADPAPAPAPAPSTPAQPSAPPAPSPTVAPEPPVVEPSEPAEPSPPVEPAPTAPPELLPDLPGLP
ncbi:hypothetical protein OVA14_13070 [Agrococcus sp. SL85]|uniref:hypothetical protein n=1 Tax=Agrococcus sp. SL85 TaxID=2995141 RepID=UPI00226D0B04|nr:hypothetical protein [Agrococcus sp. SL85]WAC66187.1 hypothetical protein OVA14_13070 [Agrococcus sp. SL85]